MNAVLAELFIRIISALAGVLGAAMVASVVYDEWIAPSQDREPRIAEGGDPLPPVIFTWLSLGWLAIGVGLAALGFYTCCAADWPQTWPEAVAQAHARNLPNTQN